MLQPGRRAAFLRASLRSVEAARRAEGNRDFVVAADPLEGDRVNVYEEWDTEDALLAFRGAGPGDDISGLIAGASVRRHKVASSSAA